MLKLLEYVPVKKFHEILISEEECHRTTDRGRYYAISPMLPELCPDSAIKALLTREYSSADNTLDCSSVEALLSENKLLPEYAQPQRT